MSFEHPTEEIARGPNAGWQGTDLDALVANENTPEVELDENGIQNNCVVNALSGIMYAGASYPFIMCVLIMLYWVVMDFGVAYDSIFDGLQAIGIISVLGGAFGAIISTFTGLLAILIVLVVNRSLGNPIDGRSAAISAGSLAGYIPTAWVFLPANLSQDIGESVVFAILGPFLAMSLGAYGANWSSKKYSGVDVAVLDRRPRYRLSILHMMIATAWIAGVFATANMLGGLSFVVNVATWLVLQAVMLGWIRLYRRFRGSSINRARKSTETREPKPG